MATKNYILHLDSAELNAVTSALYSRAKWFTECYSSADMRVYKSTYKDYLAVRSALRSLGFGFLLKDIKLKNSL